MEIRDTFEKSAVRVEDFFQRISFSCHLMHEAVFNRCLGKIIISVKVTSTYSTGVVLSIRKSF